MNTLMANLIVCALLLMAAGALWTLAHVWMERNKLGSSKLYRASDFRADVDQDPVMIDSNGVKWYPERELVVVPKDVFDTIVKEHRAMSLKYTDNLGGLDTEPCEYCNCSTDPVHIYDPAGTGNSICLYCP